MLALLLYLAVTPVHPVGIGDQAPSASLTDLDGKPFTLPDNQPVPAIVYTQTERSISDRYTISFIAARLPDSGGWAVVRPSLQTMMRKVIATPPFWMIVYTLQPLPFNRPGHHPR